jgi:mannosyltransferase OCH1-like enzyme
MIDYKSKFSLKINNDSKWLMLENLYNNNILNKTEKVDVIPKIIHQIWLGSPFPETSLSLTNKMLKLNPNYKYKLWTDLDVENFGLKNKELYNNISNLGAKSDILRYEILEREGGIYIDTDFECVKSFDELLHLDFFAANGHVDNPEVINSVIGCIPNNKVIKSFVSNLQKIKTFDDSINGVMYYTGPYFITKLIYDILNEDDNIVIFPTKYFYLFLLYIDN